MHSFEEKVVISTVDKLIKGLDYRAEIVNSINIAFFDFCLDFFKKIIERKFKSGKVDLCWYKDNFVNDPSLSTNDILINSGLNRKTITNTYGTAKKSVSLDVANNNIEYLDELLNSIDSGDINISINLTYNNIHVSLDLKESLIVINTLATRKIAIRGGAWSSIGKKVEKPLLDRLCYLSGVPSQYIDNKTFTKDKSKYFDREVDYKLYSADYEMYNVEVKLMGKGNPESADATIARNSKIFIADTLSEQNKRQLRSENIEFLELKNNPYIIDDFKRILYKLNIPYDCYQIDTL